MALASYASFFPLVCCFWVHRLSSFSYLSVSVWIGSADPGFLWPLDCCLSGQGYFWLRAWILAPMVLLFMRMLDRLLFFASLDIVMDAFSISLLGRGGFVLMAFWGAVLLLVPLSSCSLQLLRVPFLLALGYSYRWLPAWYRECFWIKSHTSLGIAWAFPVWWSVRCSFLCCLLIFSGDRQFSRLGNFASR